LATAVHRPVQQSPITFVRYLHFSGNFCPTA
jgi:hypothetical protein